jgi:hypothetical protein
MHDLFNEAQLLVRDARIGVPDDDSCRDESLADQIGAELLQRLVGIHRLVAGVAVEKGRGLIGHDLL